MNHVSRFRMHLVFEQSALVGVCSGVSFIRKSALDRLLQHLTDVRVADVNVTKLSHLRKTTSHSLYTHSHLGTTSTNHSIQLYCLLTFVYWQFGYYLNQALDNVKLSANLEVLTFVIGVTLPANLQSGSKFETDRVASELQIVYVDAWCS